MKITRTEYNNMVEIAKIIASKQVFTSKVPDDKEILPVAQKEMTLEGFLSLDLESNMEDNIDYIIYLIGKTIDEEGNEVYIYNPPTPEAQKDFEEVRAYLEEVFEETVTIVDDVPDEVSMTIGA